MVNVKQDGTIYAVKDSSERTGKKVTGNDMIEILALQDGEMIGYWHDCNWSRNGGITKCTLESAGFTGCFVKDKR